MKAASCIIFSIVGRGTISVYIVVLFTERQKKKLKMFGPSTWYTKKQIIVTFITKL